MHKHRCIGDLRKILSSKLNLDINECVLRRKWNDSEFKNNKKLLSESRLHSGIIYVEKGTPLNPDQYLFQVFVKGEYNKKKFLVSGYIRMINSLKSSFERTFNVNVMYIVPESVKELCFDYYFEKLHQDNLDYVGNIILNKNWLIKDVKFKIFNKYELYVPHPNVMRIRDFVKEWNKHKMCDEFVLRDVYYDNLTIYGNIKSRIKDYQQIACQRIEYKEKDLLDKKKHLLLHVCQYYPTQKRVGNVIEMQFNKSCKIKTELRKILSEYSGIKYTHIKVSCFPKANRLDDGLYIYNSLSANKHLSNESTLINSQWKCKNGYFIVFSGKE